MTGRRVEGIRAFKAEDIPEVAALWLKVFQKRAVRAPESLRAYFHEIFFGGPWRDPTLPSLVYLADRRIAGFLGVMPRPLRFRGEPIRAAIATQLMVDDTARALYPGVKLVKQFFAGAQDLSFSDGANESSERLWKAAGGTVSLLHSLEWTRVLRPVQCSMVEVRRRRPRLAVPIAALAPAWQLCDAFAVRGIVGRWLRRYSLSEMDDVAVEWNPTSAALLSCIREASAPRTLQPDYHVESLGWLLEKAAEKQVHGKLRQMVVRGTNGQALGWCLYYLQRGQPANVLHFGGQAKSVHRVLDCLFLEAWKDGAVAVCGALEPRFARALAERHCGFMLSSYSVVAHSRRPEILDALARGDAFLTRLEGEWWARFSDPGWILNESAGNGWAPKEPAIHDSREVHAG